MHNILAQITVANIGTFEQAEFKTIVDTSSSQTILEILKSFGVEGQIVGTETGPIVTSVYFAPAPGIRISSITERTDDLQVALGVSSLKISLAPEKKAVAIEVPNLHPCKIPFGNIFHSAHNGMRLPAALGVDTKGNPVYLDIAQTPHLLIAGQTGSGKSVCLNSIIVSLALHCRPVDLQFLLIDPKRVEFFPYEQMHNLISGHVIKNVDEAIHSLKWLVQEMEVRNTILEKCRCRNINDFKKKLNQGQIEGMPIPYTQDMPYIVAVIDEYADLMMRSSKDLTDCIMALAQKARSVGIHLILATQRPSTKVISGDIKANFPTRIALRTAVATDSSTILGCGGAEKLLGKGDMLLSCDGDIKRIHGCYISDEEIDKAISALPSDNLFYFNNENIFTTDFEAYISNQFKDRPTWGEINAVCKAALENLNDYFDGKEYPINLDVSKEELTSIRAQIRYTYDCPEVRKQIAKYYIQNQTIEESEFIKFIIYNNLLFEYKIRTTRHPFAQYIVRKAFCEDDKRAFDFIQRHCIVLDPSFHYAPLLAEIVNLSVYSNERAKDVILDHYCCFDIFAGNNLQKAIIYWANEGNRKAINVIYENCGEALFKKEIFEWIKTNKNGAKDFIFTCSGIQLALFEKIIIDWANEGDEKAKAFVLEKFKNIEEDYALQRFLIDRANNGNDWAKKLIIENYIFFVDTIIDWAKEGNERAKILEDEAREIVQNDPDNFKKSLIKWTDENDEWAENIVCDNFHNFYDYLKIAANNGNNWARKNILKKYNVFANADRFHKYQYESDLKSITYWAIDGDKDAYEFIMDNIYRFKDTINEWVRHWWINVDPLIKAFKDSNDQDRYAQLGKAWAEKIVKEHPEVFQ